MDAHFFCCWKYLLFAYWFIHNNNFKVFCIEKCSHRKFFLDCINYGAFFVSPTMSTVWVWGGTFRTLLYIFLLMFRIEMTCMQICQSTMKVVVGDVIIIVMLADEWFVLLLLRKNLPNNNFCFSRKNYKIYLMTSVHKIANAFLAIANERKYLHRILNDFQCKTRIQAREFIHK